MKTVLSLSSWPLVFFSGLLLTHFAFESERPMFGFALVYAGEVLLLLLLERYIPYERHWLLPDGETANNIAHTLLTKGAVQLFALVGAVFPMLTATVLQPFAGARFDLWPTAPPMPFQAAIAVVVAEFASTGRIGSPMKDCSSGAFTRCITALSGYGSSTQAASTLPIRCSR